MSNYTQKRIVCGADNLEGKLVPAPLDEKNLTTDWLDDFLFAYNRAKSRDDRICGYIDLEDEDMLCEVSYCDNCVTYDFPGYNYISKDDMNEFAKKLANYFYECENLTIKATCEQKDKDTLKPQIRLHFYFRCEE